MASVRTKPMVPAPAARETPIFGDRPKALDLTPVVPWIVPAAQTNI